MSGLTVRDACSDDIAAITAIYAESVANGRGTFELEAPDETEMAARLAAVQALGLPRLVVEIDGAVAGYAYAGPFRTRQAYRYMVEDSIYVAPWARGRGVAGALLDALSFGAKRWVFVRWSRSSVMQKTSAQSPYTARAASATPACSRRPAGSTTTGATWCSCSGRWAMAAPLRPTRRVCRLSTRSRRADALRRRDPTPILTP